MLRSGQDRQYIHNIVYNRADRMSPKQRFQILLDPEQLAALRRIEDRTGAPVARQIRMAVDRWLDEQGEKPERKRAVTRKRS
jgi:hypothetical protein